MLTVLGSINVDIAVEVAVLPQPGETVLGRGPLVSPGGKGANQAHAARLFGAETALIGAVGEDEFAAAALPHLRDAGVDLSGVRRVAGAATGVACIAVSAAGENAICVASGANAAVRGGWFEPRLAPAASSMLLLQMEVPVQETLHAARAARAAGWQVMLNAAPAGGAEAVAAGCIDWLVVNQSELAAMCLAQGWRQHGAAAAQPELQARWLARHLEAAVVVTLGGEGVLAVLRGGNAWRCSALPVQVRDTTGAGDTFTGVLAAALVQGFGVAEALRHAVVAGGLSCRAPGAQIAQPSRAAIDAALPSCPAGQWLEGAAP